MSFFNWSEWLRSLVRRPRLKPFRRTKRNYLRLHLEALEDRTLMAVAATALPVSNLPVPLVTNQTSLGAGTYQPSGSVGGSFLQATEAAGMNPQLTVDPMNPQKMVVVASNGNALVGYYSTDGGQAWNNFM